MTAKEIIRARLNHKPTKEVPFELLVEQGLDKRLALYYNDKNWRRNMLRQYTCRYLHVDTVMMQPISDTRARDAYGAVWRTDRYPEYLETPPLSEPDFKGYDFPKAGRFIDNIKNNIPWATQAFTEDSEHYGIISMGWGLFEHSWRILGFENALVYMLTDEGFYKELIDRLAELYIEIIKVLEPVPADSIMLGDDWGDQRGIIFGRELWLKYFKPAWAKIYDEIHKQGKTVIHHSCGSICEIYDDLAEIGMDCHESVQPEAAGMKPSELKKRYGDRMCFWGCLGSQGILNSGTPAEIKAEIKRLADIFDEGGFVLSAAKPLLADMPLDKAVAVVEGLAELG